MNTIFDDQKLGYTVTGTGKGEFPFVVWSCNAKVAAFAQEHRAVEYAAWPSRAYEAADNTAESIIAACRAMPYAAGRNLLNDVACRLDDEIRKWDAEVQA